MNIYNISCRSRCGSYFSSYQQSLTIIAENKEDAVKHAQQWMTCNRNWFIERDTKEWHVEEMQQGVAPGVINWHEGSDY